MPARRLWRSTPLGRSLLRPPPKNRGGRAEPSAALSDVLLQRSKCPHVSDLALPNHQHAPSRRKQLPPLPPIPALVGSKLRSPPLSICCGQARVLALRMPMPKTSMDEHRGTVARKHEIRSAG